MSKPQKPKKVREKSKTRAWEKERRNRINNYFNKLWEVLPIYDSSKSIAKTDILINAVSTINDLNEKLKNLLASSDSEKLSKEKLKVSSELIEKLQVRVKKLVLRNEQLTGLLNRAGIKVPTECGTVKKLRKAHKYDNAITPEQKAVILQKELEKENQVKVTKPKAPKAGVKRKRILTKSKDKKSKKQLVSPSKCLLLVSQPAVSNSYCFILSKRPPKVSQTVLTNSLLVKTPIVSSDIKATSFPTYPQLPNLGQRSLVLVNGTAMPVVPAPQPLPIVPTILTHPSQLSTVIVVSSKNNLPPVSSDIKSSQNIPILPNIPSTVNSVNSLPILKFRTNITKTTQVNKVPIPALSSKYYKHTCLSNKKTDQQSKKNPNTSVSTSVSQNPVKKKTQTTENTQSEIKKLKSTSVETSKVSELDSLPISKNEGQQSTREVAGPSGVSQSNLNVLAIEERSVISANGSEKATESRPKSSQNAVSRNKSNSPEVPTSKGHTQVGTSESASTVNRETFKAGDLITSKISSVKKSPEPNNSTEVAKPKEVTTEIKKKTPFQPSDVLAPTNKELTTTCSNTNDLTVFTTVTSHPDITSCQTETKSTSNILFTTKNFQPIMQDSERCMVTTSSSQINDSLKLNPTASANSGKTAELQTEQKHFTTTTCQNTKSVTTIQTGIVTQSNTINDFKSLEMSLPHTELSNDIFASFQVPPGCQNPESTSPTAAFLLAFPLVSSGVKVAEVMGDENTESQVGTPNLLQIGTMDISKPVQSYAESLTPNLLNFDSFSFFNNKDYCGGFYNNCSLMSTTNQSGMPSVVTTSSKIVTSFASTNVNNSRSNPVKNDQPKSSEGHKYNYSGCDIVSNKPSCHNNNNINNNKVAINPKASTQNTFTNNSGNVNYVEQCSTQTAAAKEFNITNISQNVEKVGNSSLMHVNSNILDTNNDIFSFKTAINENYSNNNKQGQISNSMPRPVLTTKSSNTFPDYSNYKSANSTASNQFVVNKYYPPVYTSASVSNTYYNTFATHGGNRNFNSSNCSNYTDYNRKSFANSCNNNTQMFQKEKTSQNMQAKVKLPSQNKPINWMTTPNTTATSSYKPDYFLPPFSKDTCFNSNLVTNTSFSTLPSNTYFNSSVYNPNNHLNITQEFRKAPDITLPSYSSYQRIEAEENNQFSWSPNKMPYFLDTTHAHSFVSSTLPTLVGDLALNNTPAVDQKNLKERNRENRRKTGNCENQNQNGSTNFFSVSQLVEQSQENVPAKVVSRRSSGNRSKTNTPKSKRTSGRLEPNKDLHNYQKNEKSNFNLSVATNLFNDGKQLQPRNNTKNNPSSYSAEALIGNQGSSESPSKRNNPCQSKSVVPSFFNENMVSYFPSIEVSQENSYMHQSYQPNTFTQPFTTTFQNNTYGANNFIPTSCTITSSYISTNSFMPNSSSQDFLGESNNLFQNSNTAAVKDKCNFAKNYYKPEKEDKNQSYSCKKAKKRPLNENVLPSFDIHFFSMPGAINSPILPDDFHTTYLPPTTLYSCKNPLYSKSNSEAISSCLIPALPAISSNKPPAIQHPSMSPSVNTAGTTLTNFNLSTIFPEIKKGPVQEAFSDNRNKDFSAASKTFPAPSSSSLQVPFSNKSSIIF